MVCIFAHKVSWIFHEILVKYEVKMTEYLDQKFIIAKSTF